MKLQRFLLVVLVAGAALPAPTRAADPQPTAPPASPIRPADSGAAAVGKLLSPAPRDPGVPLPDPNLPEAGPDEVSSPGARPYARPESGGGVVGLRIPIPAARSP